MYRDSAPTSPLVIVTSGRRVVAHERQTGAPVWEFIVAKTNVNYGATRSVVAGGRVLVFAAGEMESTWSGNAPLVLSCLDYASGTPLWEHSIATELNVAFVAPTVLIDGGQILVVCANRLSAFALADGTPLWTQPLRTEAAEALPAGLAVEGAVAHADRR